MKKHLPSTVMLGLLLMIVVGCRSQAEEELTRPRESMIEGFHRMAKKDLSDQSPAFRARVESQVRGVCHVHDLRMERRWVPVIYGTHPPGGWPPKVEEDSEFPNSDAPVVPGDVVRPTQQVELYVCSACSAAYARWKATEPNQSPQRNAGSRPSSNDLPASETPSSLGPRG